MSLKIFAFVILGLILVINESEAIRCYDCTSNLHGDSCNTATNLTEKDCPNEKYCFKLSGLGKSSLKLEFILKLLFFYSSWKTNKFSLLYKSKM